MSHNSGLERVLRARDVVALAFGAMIGWGWVVLAGDWVQTGGALGAVGAFVVGGTAVAVIGLTYAELAAAMPEVGGEHVYSERALGRTASFVCTWAIVFGYVSVVAFEAVALPVAVEALLPGLEAGYLYSVTGWDVHASWVAVGAVGAIAMMALNVLGIRPAAVAQTIATGAILVAGLVFMGGAAFGSRPEAAQAIDWGFSGDGLLRVLVMVPFLFVGFDVIPQAAEEIDVPPRRIGALLMFSVLLAVIWYIAIVVGVTLGLPASQLEGADVATAEAATSLFGSPLWGNLIVIAGVAGILTSWNSFLVGGSRAIFALAQAGLLPRFLGTLHPRTRAPVNAILMVGALSIVAPFLGRPALVWLVNAGGIGIVTAYAFVAVSFLVLRRREPNLERPFRVPAGTVVGWAALVLSLGLFFLYLPGSPAALVWPQEWLLVLAWTVLGAVLFFATGRQTSENA